MCVNYLSVDFRYNFKFAATKQGKRKKIRKKEEQNLRKRERKSEQIIFNRPGVAGAVLQTPRLLID